jgi:HSP20 family protein
METRAIRKRTEAGLTKVQDVFGDLFNRFFENWELMPTFEGGTWWPLLDVVEHDNEIIVKAELPGMKTEDIDISVQGNVLTISGQKRESQEDRGENYYRTERRYGSFRRDLTLPAPVDVGKVEATHEDGVLKIVLPKTEEAKPRKIKVQEHAMAT